MAILCFSTHHSLRISQPMHKISENGFQTVFTWVLYRLIHVKCTKGKCLLKELPHYSKTFLGLGSSGPIKVLTLTLPVLKLPEPF